MSDNIFDDHVRFQLVLSSEKDEKRCWVCDRCEGTTTTNDSYRIRAYNTGTPSNGGVNENSYRQFRICKVCAGDNYENAIEIVKVIVSLKAL